jgi:hypothetical protein
MMMRADPGYPDVVDAQGRKIGETLAAGAG